MRAPHLASALPVTLALVVQTVLPVQQATAEWTAPLLIPAKQLPSLLTMGPTVTSTASMVGLLEGLQVPAPAQAATLGLMPDFSTPMAFIDK